MRKIRGFRLKIPHKDFRRRARKIVDLNALGLADDRSIELAIKDFLARVRPAVIFDSFGPESETAELSSMPGLAHTLGLVSLGPDVGPMVAEAGTTSESRGKLLELMVSSAIDQAVQFVIGLLKEEVEAERCQLSPIQHLRDADAEAVLRALDGGKIGMALEAGRLTPERSTAFCLTWLAKPRRARKPRPKAPSGRKR